MSFLFLFIGCAQNDRAEIKEPANAINPLYANAGKEFKAHFHAVYRSPYKTVEAIESKYLASCLQYAVKFLFGPLTYRALGGAQKGEIITPHIDQATIENGRVLIPYDYEATWMVDALKVNPNLLNLPLPFSPADLMSTNWKACTDNSDSTHATSGFLWYFWDPTRPGCENREGVDYQMIQVHFDQETSQTIQSFPEYDRMIHSVDGHKVMAMTFAFGYVTDLPQPKPFTDRDLGMRQFQQFYANVRRTLLPQGFKESPILQSEFNAGTEKIGARFIGQWNDVAVEVSVVSNAGVDQMDLFAHSFAELHEGFFGWFGHSRVGDGFDANHLKFILNGNSKKFFLTDEYQLVYWAGCNSYSYYTLPFFDLKAEINPALDPKGTRNLDIISNTLPSLFAFYADNANIMFETLIQHEQRPSFQNIIDRIEQTAHDFDYSVIVNVLGDEDNK